MHVSLHTAISVSKHTHNYALFRKINPLTVFFMLDCYYKLNIKTANKKLNQRSSK